MSTPSQSHSDHAVSSADAIDRSQARVRTSFARLGTLSKSGLASVVSGPLEAIGFWSAIALPLFYFPLLSSGLSADETFLFVGLLVLNVVALIAGRGHKVD